MEQANDRSAPLIALVSLLSLGVLIRVVIAFLIGPGFDEAYYYLYSKNLALSYFDHPPLVALWAGIGPALLGVVSAGTIRLGPILLFILTQLLMWKLAQKWTSPRASLWAVGALGVIPLFSFGAGLALLPDAPMSLFWVAALLPISSIMKGDTRLVNYLGAGVLCGCTLLAKYHGILLIGGFGLYLLFCRPRELLTIKPWISFFAAIVCFAPVIVWNYQHDWVSFTFQGARAGTHQIRYALFFQALGGQLLYLTPMAALPLFFLMGKGTIQAWRSREPRWQFVFFCGVIPVCFFLAISFTTRILPHWTLAGYLAAIPLLGEMLHRYFARSRLTKSLVGLSVGLIGALMVLAIVHIRTGIFLPCKAGQNGLLERRLARSDATLDMVGWDELASFIKTKGISPQTHFLVTSKWFIGGQVALATGGRFEVDCINRGDQRGFAFWNRRQAQLGKKALLIGTSRYPAESSGFYLKYFAGFGATDTLTIYRGGCAVKQVHITELDSFFLAPPSPYLRVSH